MALVVLPEIRIFFFDQEGLGRQKAVKVRDAPDGESATCKRIENIPRNYALIGNDPAFTCDLCLGNDRGDLGREAITTRSCMSALPAHMEGAVADRDAPHMARHLAK